MELGMILAMASLVYHSVAKTENPIDTAIGVYDSISAYQVTLKSESDGKTEIIRYYFKKPGYVRIEFLMPYKGGVLVYDPTSKNARVWPFGHRTFPGLTLSPDNRLIQSSAGQRVDRSDIGVLYENIKSLQEHGTTASLELDNGDGQKTVYVTIESEDGYTIGDIAKYQLWLDPGSWFPLKVLSLNAKGQTLEAVEMEGLKIDPEFSGDFFKQ